MKRVETDLPGVMIIRPEIHEDERGFFVETYTRRAFDELGIACTFQQDNFVFSGSNVLRGLHYQVGRQQAKLVRVASGEIFDVAVDVRRGSPTFGKWTGVRLSAQNQVMLFVPQGFAHGYCVLSESASVAYKCSDYYAADCERGIAWNDPDIGIAWPLVNPDPVISEKDAGLKLLSETEEGDLPVYEAGD